MKKKGFYINWKTYKGIRYMKLNREHGNVYEICEGCPQYELIGYGIFYFESQMKNHIETALQKGGKQ